MVQDMVKTNYRKVGKTYGCVVARNFLIMSTAAQDSGLWWTVMHNFVGTGMGGQQPHVQGSLMAGETNCYTKVHIRYWQIPSTADHIQWLRLYCFSSGMIVLQFFKASDGTTGGAAPNYTSQWLFVTATQHLGHFIIETPIVSIA